MKGTISAKGNTSPFLIRRIPLRSAGVSAFLNFKRLNGYCEEDPFKVTWRIRAPHKKDRTPNEALP